ncbi:MAG: HEPN domain-containing protein [Candidatus Micrarchaeia archaeon]
MDKLERCFNGSREIPPRLLQKEVSINAAEAHLKKAEGNLLTMEILLREKRFDWSVVAAYYAMYHATLSLLWLIGIDARSHECAIAAFETFYAKKGKVSSKYVEHLTHAKNMSEQYAETLEQIKTLRTKASYGIGEIKSPDTEFAKIKAKEFVSAVREILFEAKGSSYERIEVP